MKRLDICEFPLIDCYHLNGSLAVLSLLFMSVSIPPFASIIPPKQQKIDGYHLKNLTYQVGMRGSILQLFSFNKLKEVEQWASFFYYSMSVKWLTENVVDKNRVLCDVFRYFLGTAFLLNAYCLIVQRVFLKSVVTKRSKPFSKLLHYN